MSSEWSCRKETEKERSFFLRNTCNGQLIYSCPLSGPGGDVHTCHNMCDMNSWVSCFHTSEQFYLHSALQSQDSLLMTWHFHSYYSNIVSNLYFESYLLVFAYYSHHSPPHPTRIQSFFEILQFQLSEPSRLEWKHVFSNTDRSLNNNINDAKVTLLDSWQRALRHHLDNPRRCSRSLKSKRRENRWWCNKKSHMNKKMNNRIEKRVETEKQRSVQTCSSYSLLFFRSCNTIGVV